MKGAFPGLLAMGLLAACGDGGGDLDRVPGFDGGFLRWTGSVDRPDGGGTPDLPDDGGAPPDLGSDAGVFELGADAEVEDPCLAPPVATVSASVALARADLRGQVVAVIDAAEASPPACDPSACPPEEPCCNTCRAEVRLGGVLPIAGSECLELSTGCVGSSCGLVCVPPVFGFSERFVGRLQTEDGEVVLQVLRGEP